jgi:hypothetical protein
LEAIIGAMDEVSSTAKKKSPGKVPKRFSQPDKEEEGSTGKKPPNHEGDIDAHPHKQRKMTDLDTPSKRPRGNLTLRGLLPMPINHASRKRKAEARLKKMVCESLTQRSPWRPQEAEKRAGFEGKGALFLHVSWPVGLFSPALSRRPWLQFRRTHTCILRPFLPSIALFGLLSASLALTLDYVSW